MKKIFLFIAIPLTVIADARNIASQAGTANNNSLLWRVSGKNLPAESYIFGTTHLICRDDYVWTTKMMQSLAESSKICLEMDMDDPEVLLQISTALFDKSGRKLEGYFTPAQYKLLNNYVKDSLGMDISLFKGMKPLALQYVFAKNAFNCPNPISYEDSIMKTAQKSKKEILGLEQPAEVMAALETIPVDSIVEDLMRQIQHTEKNDSDYNNLITAYKNQDIKALYNLVSSSKDLGDMGVFLDERNRKWIPRITTDMKNSSVFFAVGAGHLWGNNGIINLLRKEGYTVEPLR